MNSTSFVGNLCADPQLHTGQNGKVRASFRVAVNEGNAKDGTEKTHFVDVTTFDTLASNVAGSLTKGDRVLVVGRLNSYETRVVIDGEEKPITRVAFTAVAIGPDLRFATATVVRNPRPSGQGDPQTDQGWGGNAAAQPPGQGPAQAVAQPAPAPADASGWGPPTQQAWDPAAAPF